MREDDPRSVKLVNLGQQTSEDDIRQALSRFGNILRIKIPEDPNRKKRYGFAIVGFDSEAPVQRLLEEKEITVGIVCLAIEKATIRRMEKRNDGDAKAAFTNLTRQKQ